MIPRATIIALLSRRIPMKPAKSGIFLLLISLFVVLICYIFISGCISSALSHKDMIIPDQEQTPALHPFPPMYNYPKDSPVIPADDNPPKFVAGDILQPVESSPVFDPDVAVVVTRDNGNGSYEIDGLTRSDGTWSRISGSVPGIVSHSEVERLFPDKAGHTDITTLS